MTKNKKFIKYYNPLILILIVMLSLSCSEDSIVTPNKGDMGKQKKGIDNLTIFKAGTYADEVSPGWNADDATACLQNAINTGDSVIIIRRMSSKWIVRNIYLKKPNQEIFFEEGVEVKAKRGEFHATTSPVFELQAENVKMIGYGATISMWKEDYMDSNKYEFGEWRHCIRVKGAKNFTIKGLLLKDSGGDGIEVAGDFSYNSATDWSSGLIEDVVADNNYRQGLSVISCKGLTIRNSVFKNTIGTSPQSGIDIEPWNSSHILQDLLIENCRFENNAGDDFGYTLYWLNNSPHEISMTFKDCVTDGAKEHGVLCDVWPDYGPPSGYIKFINFTIRNSQKDGIRIRETDPTKASLTFENCKVINCGAGKYDWFYYYPIYFAPWGGEKWDNGIIGNVNFINCGIKDDKSRYAVNFSSNTFLRGGLNNVHGTITVENNVAGARMPAFHVGDTTNVTLRVEAGTVDDPILGVR